MSRLRIAGVVLGCALAPALARADAPDEAPPEARAQFEQGRALRARSDCADAIPRFRAALASYPAGLGSLRNIAECEEALGEIALARAAWSDLGRALTTRGDPRYEGWTDDARRAEARLALTAPAPSVAVPPDGDRRSRADAAKRTAGWASVGVGTAGLIGAGISLLVRQSALDTIRGACTSGPGGGWTCPQRADLESALDRGRTATTWADVLLAIGVVGLGTGIVLVATSASHAAAPAAGLVLSPAGVSAVGRF